MKSLLSYFVTKEDRKEVTREITRTNGDKITQTVKTTTRYFDIPTELKEAVQKEVLNHLGLNNHDKLIQDREL